MAAAAEWVVQALKEAAEAAEAAAAEVVVQPAPANQMAAAQAATANSQLIALPESAIHVEKPLDFHLIFSRAAGVAVREVVFLPALADSVVAAAVVETRLPALPALAESVVAAVVVEKRRAALADSVVAAVRMALTVQALAARASSLLNGESDELRTTERAKRSYQHHCA